MIHTLFNVGPSSHGGFDFGVNGSVVDLTLEQMNELRAMIVAGIGTMEDMWRREQQRKSPPAQASETYQKLDQHLWDNDAPSPKFVADQIAIIKAAIEKGTATLAHAFESERELRKRYEDELRQEKLALEQMAGRFNKHLIESRAAQASEWRVKVTTTQQRGEPAQASDQSNDISIHGYHKPAQASEPVFKVIRAAQAGEGRWHDPENETPNPA